MVLIGTTLAHDEFSFWEVQRQHLSVFGIESQSLNRSMVSFFLMLQLIPQLNSASYYKKTSLEAFNGDQVL